ncbi:hypothetical protein BJ508DRAFT_334649 [Ascobolus immersus RN42]|uniref:DUF6589 domain-containing protein n=1 Tax=Ascobolus immersus RN42 TaxID=1160509 RepID=A0A3N4HT68_ASCIM|nr:hypothetical protein BJ508DRAFT_334649 [Ascobolus immersus RN42]
MPARPSDRPRPSPDDDLKKRIDYAVDLLDALGLGTPLHLFRLQIEQAHSRGRHTKEGKRVKLSIEDDRFEEDMAAVLTHPMMERQVHKLAWSQDGVVMSRMIVPMVAKEMSEEMDELIKGWKLPIDKVTPADMEGFEFSSLIDNCKEKAPTTWRIIGSMVGMGEKAEPGGKDKNKDGGGSGDESESSADEASQGRPRRRKDDTSEEEDEDEDGDWENVDENGNPIKKKKKKKKKKGKKKKVRKNKELMAACALALLGYAKTKNANLLQVIIGYFLMAARVPKRAIAVLSRLGICVSYESNTRMAKRLSTELRTDYRHRVKLGLCIWVWDNLNQMYGRKKTMISHQRHMSHETQTYLIFPDNSRAWAGTFLTSANIRRERALQLRLKHIKPDTAHLIEAATAFGAQILKDNFPDELAELWKEDGMPKAPAITPLPATKTHVAPIPCVRLNEGRVDETISVIDFMERETGCDGSWYGDNDIVQAHGGDFLTVRNANKALYQRVESTTVGDSKAYLESSIELFHFQMAAQSMISATHWGRDDGKDLGSISRYQQLIGDNKVDKDCKDFRACEYLHMDMLSAYFIACLMAACGADTPEALCEYLLTHQWLDFLRQVCTRLFDPLFFQNKKFNKATGEKKWKTTAGPSGGFEEDGEAEPGTDGTGNTKPRTGTGRKKKTGNKDKAPTVTPGDTNDEGPSLDFMVNNVHNIPLDNALLFTRDMLAYAELRSAIKEGDPGRVVECIKFFCVCFQGTGKFNYARVTIHLIACCWIVWIRCLSFAFSVPFVTLLLLARFITF